MSLMNQLVFLTFIDLLWITNSANFQCTGSHCKCVDATGCETNCMDGFCQDKDFICTKNINYCSFNCQDEESCQSSTFYMASNQFYMNCIGSNSCNNTEVYCGIPPQAPSDTTMNDFNTDMQTCAISASHSSMRNSYISCDGNIENCHIDSEASTMGAVFDSQFDCSVDIGTCEFDCNYGCYRSLYTCQTASNNQCICNGCQQTDGVIIQNINISIPSNTDIVSSTSTSTLTSTSHTSHTTALLMTSTTATTATPTAVITTDTAQSITIDIDTDRNPNNESVVRNHSPLFNFTDGKISNLEILYYIIMGAGGCLCCFICLCISAICLVRSSLQTKQKLHSNSANNGAATSSEIGSSDSICNMDSVIDMASSVNSSDTCSTKNTPIYINGDDTPKSDDKDMDEKDNISDRSDEEEDENEYKPPINHHNIRYNNQEMNNMDRNRSNSSVQNLKIKLTKPANERPQKRKKKKKSIEKSPPSGSTSVSISRFSGSTTTTSNSKSGHSHLSKNPLRFENNHLSPHLRHKNLHSGTQSPMSPLSSMDHTSLDSMDSMTSTDIDSITSGNSSEMNLKFKSADPNRIGFLQPKQFQEIMANYASATASLSHSSHSNTGNTATQFAAIQEQLLYIQQQNQLLRQQKPIHSFHTHSSNHSNDNKIIKPSLHRHHTVKSSNPKLTIIHSGNYDSNAMSEVDVQDIINGKPHTKQISTRTHSYTESASSNSSEESCSCSDCNKQQRLTTPIGTPASGAGSSNASSASSSGSDDSTCVDTRCSCPHCRNKSCLSGLSGDTTPDSSMTNSRESSSSSESESSSESSSDSSSSSSVSESDSSHSEYKKRVKNKVQSPDNASAMSMTPIGVYERGNNKTMIIHDDVDVQSKHSRQYTLSTVGGPGDHNRFGTLVIHNVTGDANANHVNYID